MTYAAQSLLAADPDFQARVRASAVEQSRTFLDDGRADIAALAADLLRNSPEPLVTFFGLLAAAPGLADAADNGDGTVDSSRITDADILAAVQADYPTVAALYFDDTGAPLP